MWFYTVCCVIGRSSGAPWPFALHPSGNATFPAKALDFDGFRSLRVIGSPQGIDNQFNIDGSERPCLGMMHDM